MKGAICIVAFFEASAVQQMRPQMSSLFYNLLQSGFLAPFAPTRYEQCSRFLGVFGGNWRRLTGGILRLITLRMTLRWLGAKMSLRRGLTGLDVPCWIVSLSKI